jgi:hypothetical protein
MALVASGKIAAPGGIRTVKTMFVPVGVGRLPPTWTRKKPSGIVRC